MVVVIKNGTRFERPSDRLKCEAVTHTIVFGVCPRYAGVFPQPGTPPLSTERLDIAIIHSSFEARGGGEVLLADFARALLDRGHRVRILTFGFDSGRWGEAFQGAEVVKLKRRGTWEKIRPWNRLDWYRRCSVEVEMACRGCDVVIAVNDPAPTLLGLSGSKTFKLWYCLEPPRSLHVEGSNPNLVAALRDHHLDPRGLMGSRIRRALKKHSWKQILSPHHRDRARLDLAGVRAMDGVWALSAFSAENVQKIYGREATVFSPAVPFPSVEPVFRPLNPRCLQILSLSRLEAYKGFETLLRGISLFLAKHPGRATLDVVGQGRDRTALVALAEGLALGDAVRFHGFLPDTDLEAIWSRADAFALLPADEPFGMVFVEAAARGVIAIGPDHGGPAEILEGGEGGILVDAFDPGAFAIALERLLELPSEAVLGSRQHAYRNAVVQFALANLGKRLESRLRALLN